MAKKTFRDKLKELRLAKNLSQAALARLCGISHQAVSLFESGQNVPLWRTVQLFTLALGIQAQHPLSDDDVELPSGPETETHPVGRPAKVTAPAEPPSRPTSKRSASKVIQEPVEPEKPARMPRRKKKGD